MPPNIKLLSPLIKLEIARERQEKYHFLGYWISLCWISKNNAILSNLFLKAATHLPCSFHLLNLRTSSRSKAQHTQGLSAFTKVTAFKAYHKLIRIQLHNLINQTSASKAWPNLSFKVLTKNLVQNLDQNSASISLVKILDQTSASKSLPNCGQHALQHHYGQC